MRLRLCRLAVASVALIGWIGFADAASVQLSGTGFPAPGGTDFVGTGTPGKNDIEGLGRTWTLSNFDDTQYDTLYYVVGDYPGGIWDPSGPRIGLIGSTLDLMSYDAGTSDFANGIVRWTGSTTFDVSSTPTTLDARFTLTVTDTSNVAQSLVDASTISGMPLSVGAAYEVTGDFKANWLVELRDPTSGNWVPALDEFDALATNIGDQLQTSQGGAFYFTPVRAFIRS